jgi:hypothetical protein
MKCNSLAYYYYYYYYYYHRRRVIIIISSIIIIDTVQHWAVLKKVIKLRVPYKADNV